LNALATDQLGENVPHYLKRGDDSVLLANPDQYHSRNPNQSQNPKQSLPVR
jgi:hypothetical protein